MHDGRVIRTVAPVAARQCEFLRDQDILRSAIDASFLVETSELTVPVAGGVLDGSAYLLEHERIPYISHPYEWGFSQLKCAALRHLDFHLWLLQRNATLSDASAYNIQFKGARPVFIDVLSEVVPGIRTVG